MTDEQTNDSCIKDFIIGFVVICVGILILMILGGIVSFGEFLYNWYLEGQCKPYFYSVGQTITVQESDLNHIGFSDPIRLEMTSITEKKEHCDNPIYIRFKDPVSGRGLKSDTPFRLHFRIKIIEIEGAYSYVGTVQKVNIKGNRY